MGSLLFSMVVCLSFAGIVWAQNDIQNHPACKYCGMDRVKFAHSRVFIQNDDGTTEGTCSLHCAAVDLALNIDKTPKAIMVVEYLCGKGVQKNRCSVGTRATIPETNYKTTRILEITLLE